METYFENIPNIGNLDLEHIFYEYGEPILFVCIGSNDKRYLCSCCRLSEKWILSQVSEEELIRLIDNSISIRSLFESRPQPPFIVSWNGESLITKFDNIIPGLLPDAKPLELPQVQTSEYRKFLLAQLDREENLKDTIVYCSERLNPSVYSQFQKKMSEFISTFNMYYASNLDKTLRNIAEDVQVSQEITSALVVNEFDFKSEIVNQSDLPSDTVTIVTSKKDKTTQHDLLIENTFYLAA